LAEDINWDERTICFTRKKLKSRGTNLKPTLFRFSAEIEALLKRRPAAESLFPYLCTVRAGDRATEFKQRCDGLVISGVSLHSYRYAWAVRALKCGFPERFPPGGNARLKPEVGTGNYPAQKAGAGPQDQRAAITAIVPQNPAHAGGGTKAHQPRTA
jgi:hypothetical protein